MRPPTSGFSSGEPVESIGIGPRVLAMNRPRSRAGTAVPLPISANLQRVLTAHVIHFSLFKFE